ncbi:TetR/AcrR family transcriptional regulator [Amycolatopsis anabasis]|uniref:TetR/AcrR family transcriptional regulator n=1 Tax=Amycolatopsis anabasis TaxID=1840409 RepID=UPI00131B5AEF|nr:TetR/AcrR family transcriptional regulator [Amycolatopsis anabasis]
MAEEQPGNRRPGGRTERNRLAVLRATLDELGAHGYPALTVEAVAERSGVHKTTIYRRWGSAEGLVAEALALAVEDDWAAPDTGSLEGDLRALNHLIVRSFTDPRESALPVAAISAAFQSDRAAGALREFYADRTGRTAEIARRAKARGELPADTDEAEVVRTACAPLFYRLFITREPVDDTVADTAARAAALAARAGAFVVVGRECSGRFY